MANIFVVTQNQSTNKLEMRREKKEKMRQISLTAKRKRKKGKITTAAIIIKRNKSERGKKSK